MYTDIPTNGDVVGMLVLLVIAVVSLLILINHHTSSSNYIDDIASWTRNYQKLQRRH